LDGIDEKCAGEIQRGRARFFQKLTKQNGKRKSWTTDKKLQNPLPLILDEVSSFEDLTAIYVLMFTFQLTFYACDR
jgi:hypothetical protein